MVTGSAGVTGVRPPRGTRPANRRQIIIEAASHLFVRDGYAAVSMTDVADAVAIGPSALYRHFRGKQDLLAVVVSEALRTVHRALTTADERLPDIAEALATAVLGHRGIGALWRREARQLAVPDRKKFDADAKAITDRLAGAISARRPDASAATAGLLASSGLAVATSVSLHSVSLPEPEFAATLAELICTVIQAHLPPTVSNTAVGANSTKLNAQYRRETILIEATKLFAAQGFASVSIEDIGASAGISGPSVYNHFPAKSDILAAAMFRGDEWLRMDMHRAFAHVSNPYDGLHRLLESYCTFVFDNPELIQVLVSETQHLAEPERHRTRVAQHAYIAEWVNLVREVHPDWELPYARIRVQALQTMMNDVALAAQLRRYPHVESALVTVGCTLLDIEHSAPDVGIGQ